MLCTKWADSIEEACRHLRFIDLRFLIFPLVGVPPPTKIYFFFWASSSRNRNRAVRCNLYPAMKREKDFHFHRSRSIVLQCYLSRWTNRHCSHLASNYNYCLWHVCMFSRWLFEDLLAGSGRGRRRWILVYFGSWRHEPRKKITDSMKCQNFPWRLLWIQLSIYFYHISSDVLLIFKKPSKTICTFSDFAPIFVFISINR